MSDTLTEIDGVGESTAERLRDAGYETFDDLVEAGADAVAEVNYITQDSAETIVLDAMNRVEAREESDEPEESEDAEELPEIESLSDEADSEDEEEVDAEPSSDDEEASEAEEPNEKSEDAEKTTELELTLTPLQHDIVVTALMKDYANVRYSNQARADACKSLLESLRGKNAEQVTLAGVTENQLNCFHSAIRQVENEYKGNNLIELMESAQGVTAQVNEARLEFRS